MTSRSPLRLRSAQMVCRYLPYRTATVVRPLRELALAVETDSVTYLSTVSPFVGMLNVDVEVVKVGIICGLKLFGMMIQIYNFLLICVCTLVRELDVV